MAKETLKFTSLMSDNEDFIFDTIAQYVEEKIHIPIRIINEVSWGEREKLLDAGQIDVAWICGLPYILRADQPDAGIELLAAPVMVGERYKSKPVYFSDVIVRENSTFHRFTDLRGASWVYNEPHSHSGYNVMRYHLATIGQTGKYFSKIIESGAHLISLEMILQEEVDASAIDSIVLEIEFKRHPEIKSKLRIIEVLGPSPIPPFVISRKLPSEIRETIREILTKMETDPSGRAALAKGQIVSMNNVRDSDYDTIRCMYQKGKEVFLQPSPTH